ncbi:MAG: hypothetical protein FWF06_03400 [Symbiobacteriaceae bacterium]|nr:hypothetical protein [Symbiobacteriaceae bacterium]
MELSSCERCDKAFIRTAPLQVLCQNCIQLEEEEFIKVKDFLFSHPVANIQTIAEALEIPQKTILRFMQSGRLEIRGATSQVCHNCGKKIDKGSMCPECQALLAREIQQLQRPESRAEPTQETHTSKKSTKFHSKRKE